MNDERTARMSVLASRYGAMEDRRDAMMVCLSM